MYNIFTYLLNISCFTLYIFPLACSLLTFMIEEHLLMDINSQISWKHFFPHFPPLLPNKKLWAENTRIIKIHFNHPRILNSTHHDHIPTRLRNCSESILTLKNGTEKQMDFPKWECKSRNLCLLIFNKENKNALFEPCHSLLYPSLSAVITKTEAKCQGSTYCYCRLEVEELVIGVVFPFTLFLLFFLLN